MYAVFHSEKRKRILVTGPRINIGKVLEEEIPDNCNFERTPPDAPIFDDNRSRNLSRWRNKHRVEKMGKRRGRKCRK